jgi:hypothetical protein
MQMAGNIPILSHFQANVIRILIKGSRRDFVDLFLVRCLGEQRAHPQVLFAKRLER